MWQGDPFINAYMRDYVAPAFNTQYGITLSIGGGQGDTLVSQLMTEKEAGRTVGSIDLVWINGETFYQLRQIDALVGPFTDRLPNNGLIAWSDPTIKYDFQKPVDGFESPWGNVQLVFIYDSARVDDPPRTMAALEAWVSAHPGRFTIDNSFTGMTVLKGFLYALAGDPKELAGPFDEAKYDKYSTLLWEYFAPDQALPVEAGQDLSRGSRATPSTLRQRRGGFHHEQQRRRGGQQSGARHVSADRPRLCARHGHDP